jgi:hypothetical protein
MVFFLPRFFCFPVFFLRGFFSPRFPPSFFCVLFSIDAYVWFFFSRVSPQDFLWQSFFFRSGFIEVFPVFFFSQIFSARVYFPPVFFRHGFIFQSFPSHPFRLCFSSPFPSSSLPLLSLTLLGVGQGSPVGYTFPQGRACRRTRASGWLLF